MFCKSVLFAAVLALAADAKKVHKIKADKLNKPELSSEIIHEMSEVDFEKLLSDTAHVYDAYMKYYGKEYTHRAEVKAHQVQWLHAEGEIQRLNANSNSAVFRHNEFSDWLPSQIQKRNGRQNPGRDKKNQRNAKPVAIAFEVEMTEAEYQALYDYEWGTTRYMCQAFDDWFNQSDLSFMAGQKKIQQRELVKKGGMSNSEFNTYWQGVEADRTDARNALVRCMDGDDGGDDGPAPEPGVCSSSLSAWEWDSTVVAPVKDQGSCGSCYAFSSLVVLEGRKAIATGQNVVTYSEQQIVDCENDYADCYGCQGGWEHSLFESSKNYPIARENVYPYTGREGACVRPGAADDVVSAASAYYIRASPSALKAEVCNGPITVGVEANSAFMYYSSGVLTSSDCGYRWADHAVGVIGWTVKDGVEAAIVKNSWGTSWGESGYTYLALDTGNQGAGPCGLLDTMAAATV